MTWQQILGAFPQLFVAAIFVLAPLGKYLLNKAAEQRARKAQEEAEQARQRELLRTGRDINAERAAAEARQAQEMMRQRQAEQRAEIEARERQAAEGQGQADTARRQEQLRRLRERRQRELAAGGQMQAGSPVAMPNQAMPERRGGAGRAVTRELWPGGPVVVVSGEEQVRAERSRVERVAEVARALQVSRAEASDQSFVQPIAEIENVRAVTRAAPAASRTVREVGAKRGVTVAGTPGVPLNAAQWRQAFVASQIFGRPGGLV